MSDDVRHYLECDHGCACGARVPKGMDSVKWQAEHVAAVVPEGICPICGGVTHNEVCRWDPKRRGER